MHGRGRRAPMGVAHAFVPRGRVRTFHHQQRLLPERLEHRGRVDALELVERLPLRRRDGEDRRDFGRREHDIVPQVRRARDQLGRMAHAAATRGDEGQVEAQRVARLDQQMRAAA